MWANRILKNYLIQGYAINEKKLKEQSQKLFKLQRTIEILNRTINTKKIELDEAKGLLDVISQYSYALKILDDYDHQIFYKGNVTLEESYNLAYEESMKIVNLMKDEFTTNLFGKEKDDSFKSSLAAIFIYFMQKNSILFRKDGSKKIADNTLVAITLMIAESKPNEKDLIVSILINLINNEN